MVHAIILPKFEINMIYRIKLIDRFNEEIEWIENNKF